MHGGKCQGLPHKARLTAVHGRFAFLFKGGAIPAAPSDGGRALPPAAPYSTRSAALLEWSYEGSWNEGFLYLPHRCVLLFRSLTYRKSNSEPRTRSR